MARVQAGKFRKISGILNLLNLLMIHVHNNPAEGDFISGKDTNCQESETFFKTKKRKMILDKATKIFKTQFMSVFLQNQMPAVTVLKDT